MEQGKTLLLPLLSPACRRRRPACNGGSQEDDFHPFATPAALRAPTGPSTCISGPRARVGNTGARPGLGQRPCLSHLDGSPLGEGQRRWLPCPAGDSAISGCGREVSGNGAVFPDICVAIPGHRGDAHLRLSGKRCPFSSRLASPTKPREDRREEKTSAKTPPLVRFAFLVRGKRRSQKASLPRGEEKGGGVPTLFPGECAPGQPTCNHTKNEGKQEISTPAILFCFESQTADRGDRWPRVPLSSTSVAAVGNPCLGDGVPPRGKGRAGYPELLEKRPGHPESPESPESPSPRRFPRSSGSTRVLSRSVSTIDGALPRRASNPGTPIWWCGTHSRTPPDSPSSAPGTEPRQARGTDARKFLR
mmetsp:Transcript_21051/g.54466  ORF Transcript_21051/g.54466 Transcript_21051/m.54466 type:complete len:362 (-) Transcript_21051:6932-8017(-)